MVKLVFKHKQLRLRIVAFLLQNDAVLEHRVIERHKTKVVVFFQVSERLRYKSKSSLEVENTAKSFVDNEYNTSALDVVLWEEAIHWVFLVLASISLLVLTLLMSEHASELNRFELLVFDSQNFFDLFQSAAS